MAQPVARPGERRRGSPGPSVAAFGAPVDAARTGEAASLPVASCRANRKGRKRATPFASGDVIVYQDDSDWSVVQRRFSVTFD